MPAIARADTVGSLLRPTYLRQARQSWRTGSMSAAELQAAEDRAVREAIALQEAAGLDVISDGELRRGTWIVTTSATSGHTAIAADPHEPYWLSLWILEEATAVEARIQEASEYVPLERLALSPQCGFASVAAGNPLTPADQEAKLRLVSQIARRVWHA